MNKLQFEHSPQSFFDDFPKSIFDLIKPAYKHDKDLNTPPLLTDSLVCKNLATGATFHGKYALHSRFMAIYKVNSIDLFFFNRLLGRDIHKS